MTTILPSERSSADVIFRDIGQSLGQTLPSAIQRYQGMQAINQLQSDLQAAGGDINKILPAIARAYTLNPSLERSGIAEQALSRARMAQGTGAATGLIGQNQQPLPSPGIQTPSGIGATTPKPTERIAEVPPSQPSEGLFLSNYLPLNLGEQITPEQRAKTLDEVARGGGDVAAARQLIDDYNQGKITQNDLANANVDKQAANVQRMLGFEDQIRQRIDKFVPEGTSEAEKNIYYNMLRPVLESKGVKSFADAWQKVSEKIDNFRKLNEAFIKNIPEPGGAPGGFYQDLEGLPSAHATSQRNAAKPIMSIDPLAYNVIEQAYMKKGWSPITVSQTFKPTPEKVQNLMKSAVDVKDLIYPSFTSTSLEFPERQMMRNLDMADERQQKDINRLSPALRKDWNDDISLLNLYSDLKSKGWTLTNIQTLFDDLADKFSERQKADRATLGNDIRVPLRYLNIGE